MFRLGNQLAANYFIHFKKTKKSLSFISRRQKKNSLSKLNALIKFVTFTICPLNFYLSSLMPIKLPWWFDQNICRVCSAKKKLVKWQKLKTALSNLKKKCLSWISSACSLLQINLEANCLDGSCWIPTGLFSLFATEETLCSIMAVSDQGS